MSVPSAKPIVKTLATILVALVIFGAGHVTGGHDAFDDVPPSMPFEQVLDGDTIVDQGRAIHIAGIDAPELGPWARCWGEAALAGFSKNHLEQLLSEDRGWHLVGVVKAKDGQHTGRVIDRDGFDIADDMRVYGGAAVSIDRWDWCRPDPNMKSPEEDARPPIGPALWWPSGEIFDQRAAD